MFLFGSVDLFIMFNEWTTKRKRCNLCHKDPTNITPSRSIFHLRFCSHFGASMQKPTFIPEASAEAIHITSSDSETEIVETCSRLPVDPRNADTRNQTPVESKPVPDYHRFEPAREHNSDQTRVEPKPEPEPDEYQSGTDVDSNEMPTQVDRETARDSLTPFPPTGLRILWGAQYRHLVMNGVQFKSEEEPIEQKGRVQEPEEQTEPEEQKAADDSDSSGEGGILLTMFSLESWHANEMTRIHRDDFGL